MGKKEAYRQALTGLFEAFVATGNAESLIGYLVSNSALPGRRANLELAAAFADLVEDYAKRAQAELWQLCIDMTEIAADEAPVNDPREFVPFCGAIGIGVLGAVIPGYFARASVTLKALANDRRWRMREAVCFGLQRLMRKRTQDTLDILEGWIPDGTLLEVRAAAAAVAEPALLHDRETAVLALRLHEHIIDRILVTQERKSEAFRTLRKGLGYTLSVVVGAIPEEGFAVMAQLIDSRDPDVLWILKQNLSKNRLVKHFAERVQLLRARLE